VDFFFVFTAQLLKLLLWEKFNTLTVLEALIRPKTIVACSGCSASHGQNHQKTLPCFWKRRKFATKWY